MTNFEYVFKKNNKKINIRKCWLCKKYLSHIVKKYKKYSWYISKMYNVYEKNSHHTQKFENKLIYYFKNIKIRVSIKCFEHNNIKKCRSCIKNVNHIFQKI